jgi:hypothetical protein
MSKKRKKKKHRSLRGVEVASPKTIEKPTTLYWAYGSNLNKRQMKWRCPKAKPVAPLSLQGGQLTFRLFADVESAEGGVIAGGLWRITRECERELDVYEGVNSNHYEKRYLLLRMPDGREEKCLYYKMIDEGVMAPTEHYFETIRQGYKDFGLDQTLLDGALARAWQDREKTPYLLSRWEAKRRPRLLKIAESEGKTVQ